MDHYRRLETQWNWWAVALSFFVGVMGCYATTFPLFMLERSLKRSSRFMWLIASCFLYGGGCIWSLHFTGMMALQIGVQVNYDLMTTIFSFFVAVIGAIVGFYVKFRNIFQVVAGLSNVDEQVNDLEMLENMPLLMYDQRDLNFSVSDVIRITRPSMMFGGLFFANAICAMHYVGMAAMKVQDVEKIYDMWRVFLSFLIAWVFSIFALNSIPRAINFKKQILFSILSTFSVFSMHYTGMSAVSYWTRSPFIEPVTSFSWNLIISVSVVVSLCCFASTTFAAQTITIQRDELVYAMKSEKYVQKLTLEKEFLERENKRKNEFIAIVSHEIRTPLNAISGFINLIETENFNLQQTESMDVVKESIKILEYTLDNILSYTRLDNPEGAIITKHETFDPCPIIWTVMNGLYTMTENHVSVFFVEPNDFRYLLVNDIGFIVQIVQNLISNAYKFTDDGHVVVVFKVTPVDNCNCICTISVQDTGIGIEREKFSEIFEPFKQIDPSLTRRHSGLGLGLSLSERIATLLNGNITVESTLHVGSVFTFSFPSAYQKNGPLYKELLNDYNFKVKCSQRRIEMLMLNEFERMGMVRVDLQTRPNVLWTNETGIKSELLLFDRNREQIIQIHFPISIYMIYDMILKFKKNTLEVQEIQSTPQRTIIPKVSIKKEGKKVLIVEDNKINQRMLCGMLSKLGYSYIIASNGKEALETIKTEGYGGLSCILMDCQMPEMDGFEATRRIRLENTDIPIVALTANVSESSRFEAQNSGMTDFLEKPLNLDKLKDILHRFT